MSDMHDNDNPLSPDTSGTSDRIGDALNAYADTIAPTDAWVGITERLEGRRSVWAFITQNPLTIGALAAAAVLIAVVAISSMGDTTGGSSGTLPVAGTGQGADARDSRLVAGTPDGALVELELSEINEAAEDGTEIHRTEVAESTLVTADAWPAAQRPDGGPGDEALLTELAATDDGLTALQTRPDNASATCAGSELTADWDLWRVDLADGDTPVRLLDGDAAPSRLPALSADGASLAFVTTSNGLRCDEALVVNVTEFETGTILATHSLPAGVVPDQLYWTPDDALYVMLPQSTDQLVPLFPVRINDPASTSSAIDFSEASFSSPAGMIVAADREGESLSTTFSYLGPDGVENRNLQVLRGNFGSDVIGAEVPYYEVPLTDADSGPTSLTADGDGGSWITVGRGTPGWPVADWDSYELYARRFATSELIGTGYLAVASLENNTPSTEPTTPPVAAADPGGDRDPLQPEDWRDVSGFAYVTPAGEIYQHSLAGAERRLLAGIDTDFGRGVSTETGGGVFTAGMAITPDEETLYVSRWFIGGAGCEAALWSIDYPAATEVPGAALVEVANGMYPAVSPDGTKLAYFVPSQLPDADYGCIFDLVVEDLLSGTATTWDGTPIFTGLAEWPSPQGLFWGPDNRTVAFSASYEGPTTYTFDTDTPTGNLTADRLDISLPEAGGSWGVSGFLDSGELAILASCDEGCLLASRTLAAIDPTAPIDMSNFRILASLPTTAQLVQVDRDGQNILYTDIPPCSGGPGDLCDSTLLWTEGGVEPTPVEVAADVDTFTWVP